MSCPSPRIDACPDVLTVPLSQSPGAIDKRQIAHSFSAAATTYDAFAALQRDAGRQLLATFQPMSDTAVIADVGCGTGWLTEHIRQLFPGAFLLGLDLAPGMLDYAALRRPHVAEGWIEADMESLPLADGCCDLLISNLAMQWLDQPLAWLVEAQRVLRPGGQLLCSTLLPGTLIELEECWQVADGLRYQSMDPNRAHSPTAHVNAFVGQSSLVEMAELAQLKGRITGYQDVRYYATVKAIMAELKGIGAHNLNGNRSPRMTGKGRLRAMLNHYESYRTQQGYPATYEVGLLTLSKASEPTVATGVNGLRRERNDAD